ncbi:MAG: protein-glutamate O-methyltransferase CheR [Acidimicrobiales bacterium]
MTSFFRDPEVWASVAESVLVPLVADRDRHDVLRLWVPACSTGEEAYTLAMLALDEVERQGRDLDVKVFATDVDRDALEIASRGRYRKGQMTGVDEARLERYFTEVDGVHTVSSALRRSVMFAPHNVTNDAPFTRLDIISCRNLFIYLNADLQARVLRGFHFALRAGGALVLGTSEGLGEQEELFAPVDATNKIFRAAGGRRLRLGRRTEPIGRLRPEERTPPPGRCSPPPRRACRVPGAGAPGRAVPAAIGAGGWERFGPPRLRRRVRVPAPRPRCGRAAPRRPGPAVGAHRAGRRSVPGPAHRRARRLPGQHRRRGRAAGAVAVRVLPVGDGPGRRSAMVVFERPGVPLADLPMPADTVLVQLEELRWSCSGRGRSSSRWWSSSRAPTRSCRPPTRRWWRPTRSCRPPTRSCRASTRSCSPSTPRTPAASASSRCCAPISTTSSPPPTWARWWWTTS